MHFASWHLLLLGMGTVPGGRICPLPIMAYSYGLYRVCSGPECSAGEQLKVFHCKYVVYTTS